MSELCRCADEVRCDMKAEIERLTAYNQEHQSVSQLQEMEIERLTERMAELEIKNAKLSNYLNRVEDAVRSYLANKQEIEL